jgi:hypothetical protein
VRLAELPLDFVENRGQWNARTKFVARKGSAAAAFERTAMKLYVGKGGRAPLSLTFEGASSEARVVGEGERRGRYNFFLGDDPARWRAGVAAYESILYRGVYAGIDVRVRESAPQLEYDSSWRRARPWGGSPSRRPGPGVSSSHRMERC